MREPSKYPLSTKILSLIVFGLVILFSFKVLDEHNLNNYSFLIWIVFVGTIGVISTIYILDYIKNKRLEHN